MRKKQRVPIWRGLGHGSRTNGSGGTRPVFHDDRLPQSRGQLLRNGADDRI